MARQLCGDMNWDTLWELAEEHGVQGMMARRLEEAGYAGVPAAAREKLQERVRAQSLFTLSLTAELFRVLEDFSTARIATVPVKGPLVSQVAYGDPALRSFGDVDLLLAQKDIPLAMERMVRMGFVSDVPPEALGGAKIPGEYLFRRPGTQRLVELHTERTFRHYPERMRIADMLARQRRVLLDGREVPALSLEDEMVFDCVHGGKDFWERLMWVSDIAALATKYPQLDWEKVQRFANEVRATRMVLVGVQLACGIFGLPLPEGIRKSVQGDREVNDLCGRILEWLPYAGYRAPGVMARAGYRMKMAGGGVRGFGYLMRLSLSPTEDDWEQSGEERKSWLWEAMRRPFRLIRKYGPEE